jgi:hypothetical protein
MSPEDDLLKVMREQPLSWTTYLSDQEELKVEPVLPRLEGVSHADRTWSMEDRERLKILLANSRTELERPSFLSLTYDSSLTYEAIGVSNSENQPERMSFEDIENLHNELQNYHNQQSLQWRDITIVNMERLFPEGVPDEIRDQWEHTRDVAIQEGQCIWPMYAEDLKEDIREHARERLRREKKGWELLKKFVNNEEKWEDFTQGRGELFFEGCNGGKLFIDVEGHVFYKYIFEGKERTIKGKITPTKDHYCVGDTILSTIMTFLSSEEDFVRRWRCGNLSIDDDFHPDRRCSRRDFAYLMYGGLDLDGISSELGNMSDLIRDVPADQIYPPEIIRRENIIRMVVSRRFTRTRQGQPPEWGIRFPNGSLDTLPYTTLRRTIALRMNSREAVERFCENLKESMFEEKLDLLSWYLKDIYLDSVERIEMDYKGVRDLRGQIETFLKIRGRVDTLLIHPRDYEILLQECERHTEIETLRGCADLYINPHLREGTAIGYSRDFLNLLETPVGIQDGGSGLYIISQDFRWDYNQSLVHHCSYRQDAALLIVNFPKEE